MYGRTEKEGLWLKGSGFTAHALLVGVGSERRVGVRPQEKGTHPKQRIPKSQFARRPFASAHGGGARRWPSEPSGSKIS